MCNQKIWKDKNIVKDLALLAVDVVQIIRHGSRVEMVDNVSFSSRCSTFHLLSG